MKVIHDIQCSWCGGRGVTDCLTCNHESCDNCGAGGYCDCNTIRLCPDCKFGMNAVPAVPCAEHKWHNIPNSESSDMCCNCGLDMEILYK